MSDPFAAVIAALAPYRFVAHDERHLYLGLEEVLRCAGLAFDRESEVVFQDGRRGRLDFFLPESGLAIEVKVRGAPAAVLRQVRWYAEHPKVRALLLVTTLGKLARVPSVLSGKPARAYRITGGFG